MNGRQKNINNKHSILLDGIGSVRGVTLVELLFVMVIFAVVMTALYQSFNAQVRMGILREYRQAEAEMELEIVKSIIERDLSMAGYGLPETIDPVLRRGGLRVVAGVEGTNSDPDTLILRGTAIGRGTRAAQGWTLRRTDPDTGADADLVWNDAREDLQASDVVLILDPFTKELVRKDTDEWLFRYTAPGGNLETLGGSVLDTLSKGDLMYGYYDLNPSNPPAVPTQPYYAVRYYLGGASPETCAPGTQSLLRAESRTNAVPSGGDPVLNCVLDFQMALGRDRDNDQIIDQWDNGGVFFATDAAAADQALAIDPRNDRFRNLNKTLKQIRIYVLVQVGNRDPNYTYSNPDPAYAGNPATIRVGDLTLQGGFVGRDYTLTAEQRRYRWRVLTAAVTPRNIQ